MMKVAGVGEEFESLHCSFMTRCAPEGSPWSVTLPTAVRHQGAMCERKAYSESIGFLKEKQRSI
jgi:hypothetical protein